MRIKVCCMKSIGEAELAIQNGVHALGFVSKAMSGSNAISDDAIREIVAVVPPTYSTVLLTSELDPDAIYQRQRATGTNALQLAGEIDPNDGRYTVAEGATFNVNLARFKGRVQPSTTHNSFLLEALLTATIDAVEAEYGIAP